MKRGIAALGIIMLLVLAASVAGGYPAPGFRQVSVKKPDPQLFAPTISISQVKRRQRTHAASGGASEALPHEVGARPSRSEPKLNTHALYPSRSELRGITFKNNIFNFSLF